jgi:HEPN superfamily AbiU2-like protein
MTRKKIPSEIDGIYMPLFHQVTYLHTKWGIFCQLYASGSENIKLLNSSSGGFFRVCQDVLAYDILLTISRLTDPQQTGKGKNARDNLTLERLSSSIDAIKFPKLKDEIAKLLVESKNKCSFARELRNKLIAHSDLSASLHSRAALISTATKQNIEDAIESIRNVMNTVPSYFENGTVAYQSAEVAAEGNKLIVRLRQAQMYCDQLRESELSLDREV